MPDDDTSYAELHVLNMPGNQAAENIQLPNLLSSHFPGAWIHQANGAQNQSAFSQDRFLTDEAHNGIFQESRAKAELIVTKQVFCFRINLPLTDQGTNEAYFTFRVIRVSCNCLDKFIYSSKKNYRDLNACDFKRQFYKIVKIRIPVRWMNVTGREFLQDYLLIKLCVHT
jgi:hypothetical protein